MSARALTTVWYGAIIIFPWGNDNTSVDIGVSSNEGPHVLGVSVTRIIVSWDLFWGPLFMDTPIWQLQTITHTHTHHGRYALVDEDKLTRG